MVGPGAAWQGAAVGARRGKAGLGWAWLGSHGEAWRDKVWSGEARQSGYG